MSYFFFFIATIVAGTINALAGGGGLITFPLLMLVVTPVTADATSAVALFFAYPTAVWRTRDQLEGVLGRGWLWLLLIPSVLGGLIGAVLLSRMGNRSFIQLVPWLVLLATVIIVLRPILVRRDESGSVHPEITVALWPVAIAGIFLVGLYGGYFGSGIGILMISSSQHPEKPQGLHLSDTALKMRRHSERSRGTPQRSVQFVHGILRLRCASLRMTIVRSFSLS